MAAKKGENPALRGQSNGKAARKCKIGMKVYKSAEEMIDKQARDADRQRKRRSNLF